MKYLALFIFFFITISVYSEENRQYQLVDSEYKESFFSVDIGTYSGISLVSKRMQLGLGYSFLWYKGYSITTDLILFKKSSNNLSFEVGLGAGILFRPDLDGFESDFFLRVPLKLTFHNIYLALTPMAGASMFEYNFAGKGHAFLSIGYRFPIKKRIKRSTDEDKNNE